MKVGNVSETITVTGEPPVVDLQIDDTPDRRQRAAQADALPTGRNMFNLGVLIPGVTLTTGGLANQDVGGALGPNTLALGIHGGQTQDQRLTMNGVSLSTMIGGGWGGGTIPNPAGVAEMLFDTSAVDASLSTGGVRINFIAKDGGNRYSGTVFGELRQRLDAGRATTRSGSRSCGLTTPGGIVKNWDFNPGFGGPIAKDRLWFYLSGRSQGARHVRAGPVLQQEREQPERVDLRARYGAAGDAQSLVAGLQRPRHVAGQLQEQVRVPLQHPEQLLLSLRHQQPDGARSRQRSAVPAAASDPGGLDLAGHQQAPARGYRDPPHRAVGRHGSVARWRPGMISTVDQGPGAFRPGMTYRSAATFSNNINTTFHWALKASYITGAHALKVGVNDAWGSNDATTYTRLPLAYTFLTPVGAAPTPYRSRST